jgi:hypothetical protein
MFTPQEAENALIFLDRVAITGHRERIAMTQIVTKLSDLIPDDRIKPAEPEDPAEIPEDPNAETPD